MKTTKTILKTGLVGLFLMAAVTAQAQLISATNPVIPNISTTDGSTIFVYGGTGFTLTADMTSTDDGGQAGLIFTDFDWLFRAAGGGGNAISSLTSASAIPGGPANSQLIVTGLAPGFYTFIAQGKTEDAICLSPEQEFTVFVLAPLTVTITLGGDASTLYCMDDMATNTLTATAEFDSSVPWNAETNLTLENPTLADFELRYRWYKVADETPFDIGTAEPFLTNTPTTTTAEDSYTFDIAEDIEIGEWNYYVAVDYTVKASGPYTSALGGATPTIIEVTPKPGKPTITILPNP